MAQNATGRFATRFDVSRETLDRLHTYEDLIKKWNPAINLVATSTLDAIWERHFHDSAQVYANADPSITKWADLGSGGGFPAAVAAILAKEAAPKAAFVCIESDIRKCEFLRTVARTLGLPLSVLSRRIEDAPPQSADVVSARALGSLRVMLSHTHRHLSSDGSALFLKGKSWQQEVEYARKVWRFDLEVKSSETDPQAALLKIRNIAGA